jgi:hypothetical protein
MYCAAANAARRQLGIAEVLLDEGAHAQQQRSLRGGRRQVRIAVERGNTNAPTIAISERAADLLLGNAPSTGELDGLVASARARQTRPHV